MKTQDLIKKLYEIGNKTDADIEKVESVDGAVVVTFKKEEVFENKLPKSFEEFCELFPKTEGEFYINAISSILKDVSEEERDKTTDANLLPDRATAEAVLALCQLIQLRNAYNGDWVPDWTNGDFKFMIEFRGGEIYCDECRYMSSLPLYFKTEELCKEFLRCFRPLIEKLKPLFGIKEGGEEC